MIDERFTFWKNDCCNIIRCLGFFNGNREGGTR